MVLLNVLFEAADFFKPVCRQATNETFVRHFVILVSLLFPQLRECVDDDTQDEVHHDCHNENPKQYIQKDPAHLFVVECSLVVTLLPRPKLISNAPAFKRIGDQCGKTVCQCVAIHAFVVIEILSEENERKERKHVDDRHG